MTIHEAPAKTNHLTRNSTIELPTTTPRLIDVPPRRVVMCDGEGSPDSPEFGAAVGTLYAASGASPDKALEALWSEAGRDGFDVSSAKDGWGWTLLIEIGPDVDDSRLPEGLRIETFDEGRAAEVLYVGPYDDEGPTVAALIAFITKECGLSIRGRHHEIYLDDPQTCPPDQLRTILRQPVR